MQRRNLVLTGIALVIGLFAVIIANAYFTGREEQQEAIAEAQRLQRIVVASQDVGFGSPLSAANMRLVNWPAASVPNGAFTSMEDATRGGRVALRPIVVGEPVLASKVSGTDGRAVLSANLPKGKLAYTIPINTTSGVAGYVRPGDVVDVFLTRPIPGDGATANDKMTDVVLEAVPVLAVDQVADEKATEAEPAKNATLEVDSYGAQKLALSIQLGALSLGLRNVADTQTGARSTVIPRQLSASNYYIRDRSRTQSAPASVPAPRPAARQSVSQSVPSMSAASATPAYTGPTMIVTKGSETTEYEVLRGR